MSAETKSVDEKHVIPKKRGNGQLRREIWVDARGNVTRYNLAYINHEMFGGDNGRVLGYDNAHGFHHRHLFGEVAPVDFTTYEDMEERFHADWLTLKERK